MLLAGALLAAQEPQTQPPGLHLVIVAGEGAVNNIKLRTARETIVEVEDENHKPVPGAVVVFLLPANGPGGAFVTDSKSAIVVADSSGRAVMPRLQLNSTAGDYQIKVHAAQGGVEASANIAQSSVPGAAVSTGVIVGIIAAVAAAGAGAAVVASRGKSSPSTPASPASPTPPAVPSVTIGAGSGVSLGPPH
ncbi:conserved hypothetical protein [Candidatus Sulfopaludibacter sp. SbA4]|nr:conserved hypothetical protein [Candidatus Sulfopaludibacter sp. SbA4]